MDLMDAIRNIDGDEPNEPTEADYAALEDDPTDYEPSDIDYSAFPYDADDLLSDDHEDDIALYIPTWFRGSVDVTVSD